MARYRVTLASRTGVAYGVLRGSSSQSGLTFGTVLNGGGTATVNPSLTLPLISGASKRRRLSSWASEVIIERLSGPGRTGIVYGGPVSKPHADLDSGSLAVTVLPVWSWLDERTIRDTIAYGGREQTQVGADLITRYTTGLGPAGDIRMDVATVDTGQRISQQYAATDQRQVGQAVVALATAENGFDFDVLWRRGLDGGMRRLWQPYYPTKGRRVEVQLTPGRGGLRNLSVEEATDIATRVTGFGASSVHTEHAAAAIEDQYGIHDKSMSLLAANSQDLIKRQVLQYLAARLPPVDIVSFAYRVSPRTPWGFIDTGDSVRVTAGRGWLDYDGWVRVIATTTTVDPSGAELVACTAAGVPGGLS